MPGLQAGKNPVPREAGERHAGTRRACLQHFFDYVCDPVRVRTAYRCRAYPDEAQQQVLTRTFGCVRVVWNRTLAARHARCVTERKGTSYAETDRALTAMKKDPDLAFLTEVSWVPLQQALRHQHTGVHRVLRQARPLPAVQVPPRPPVRALHPVGVLHARRRAAAGQDERRRCGSSWSWPEVDVTGLDPAMVIVSREPDGRWYVTFAVDTAGPEPLPADRARRRRRPRREGLRRDLRRGADRQPAAPGAQGPRAGPLPAAAGPLPARLGEPGQGRGQGRPRPPQGPRRPAGLPAPRQHPPGPLGRRRS